jgi:NTE family protein
MSRSDEPYCLVLGGGGAKGIFHVGVWQALREMKIPVNAFIGNSIGAIVAGYLAQDDEVHMEELASRIGIDYVLNVPEQLVENGELKLQKGSFHHLGEVSRNAWSHRGLDTSPLWDRLHHDIDEERIRSSGNDLGVVTFNVSEMKPREVFIEEMEDGTIADYLLASSAVPGFQTPKIKGERFIDGGVYDNLPYTMARKRGYRRLIVVDVSGIGIKRRPDIVNTETIYIKNSVNMGGILDFDRTFLDRYHRLGYLDTLRTFGRLHGRHYYIDPDPELEGRFRDFLSGPVGTGYLKKTLEAASVYSTTTHLWSLRALLPSSMELDRRLLLVVMECAALIVGVEVVRRYTYDELIDAIDERRRAIDRRVRWVLRTTGSGESKRRINWLRAIIRRTVRMKRYGRPPYYYHRIVTQLFTRRPSRMLGGAIAAFAREMPAGLFLLDVMEPFRAAAGPREKR